MPKRRTTTRSSRSKKGRKQSTPEPFYEVETIEKAKWEEEQWLYYVKWAGYVETENSWEPGSSLNSCSWMLGKFWRDVGMEYLGRTMELLEGIEVFSSDSFREECKARLDQGEELPAISEPDCLYTRAIALDGLSRTCLIPDPGLLWTDPECLGLKGLTANDKYQIVRHSLESKKIDASQVLYRKVRQDTREDSGWLDNWKAGCVICAETEKPLRGLLACSCRFKVYCLECLRSVQESQDISDGMKEGRVSCPTCRTSTYIVSSTWVMLTQEEEAARMEKKAVERAEKRKLNKINKRLKKQKLGLGESEGPTMASA
ncbi:hypothetical protein E1B28_013880 [Marasmius oreades]|uniref:Chromo domain-containing protein n=1 Tax=Marasmius oreades TaxID=181124 RepID=A0A9P7RLB5_9AGAR|nr:uncharacterized protein E1B28_013880 [Marasmius oreades]KAG7085283.1 hypothetical protein E1B28_013880 [Marasmius oreades]